MPAPAAAAAVPLLVKAMPAIVAGVNAGIQGLTNLSNKKTAFAMYDKQRTDALADWNRNNQYNSPSAQMQRFKDAGLSPHLIYGQTNTAPPVRSVTADTPKAIAPQIDSQAANFPQYSLMLETAQQNLKNLQAQEESIKANTMKTNSETNWRNVNTDFLQATYGTRMQIEQNKMLQTGGQSQLTQEQITTQQNKNKAYLQEQAKLRAETNNILSRTELSNAQKAQVQETVENLKKTRELLGYKVDIAKFEAEAMQSIKAMGVLGNTAAQLLRLIIK